ncbi:MAG: bifunctional 2-polyprenyl-6-hydroxyphenol methylase/3-demethylubiquinol 3-O-methyltransferase UbiG, partial [Alphaproteobacteria bacterium]
ADWWNPVGKFRPLHQLNKTRLQFLREEICRHFGRDGVSLNPLTGLKILDVGCGGGLVAEPMARLGATVLGIDAAEKNILTAQTHAAATGVAVEYQIAIPEDLIAEGETFDVVLALEVAEHVVDPEAFFAVCAQLITPGGMLIAATLNRTIKSYLFAIVGAEYILQWLPRGTHDWKKFIRPSELVAAVRQAGLEATVLMGMQYDPLQGQWRLAPKDLDVNYLISAVRPKGL